jgi:alpha-amylase
MKQAYLLLTLHNHQPVGNFDHVMEDATQRCYLPVLEVLADFPSVRLTLHTTGPLLEWLIEHQPRTIELMRMLADRGQIEILGGTHNEAMAAVLPDRDVIGQVSAMRSFCEEHFGQSPRGMWLAERVWEPDLPRVLHLADVEYTLLDDVGFRFAGVNEQPVWGHFTTEKAGHPVTLFPIDQHLRYLIPFKEPEETLAHLKATAEAAGQPICLTYGDDGEKFGIWPGTYEWVFEQGWLRKFFQALTDAQDWLGTLTMSEAVDTLPSRGRVYLPTCSYDEMMEWAQNTSAATHYHSVVETLKKESRFSDWRGFIRGGIWQNFLAKYTEADRMHKRMIVISDRLDRLRRLPDQRGFVDSVDHSLFDAQTALYRAQCNDAFWHGLFGGLYLTNLRMQTWRHLLLAEAALDRLDPPDGTPDWFDLDLDGRAECTISNKDMTVIIAPHRGGSVTEMSSKVHHFNLTDTLARRPEQYHAALLAPAATEQSDEPKSIHDIHEVKETGLERLLVYDDDAFALFRDRFLDPTDDGTAFFEQSSLSHVDKGTFAQADYAVGVTEHGIELACTSELDGKTIQIIKELKVEGREISAKITMTLEDDEQALPVVYSPELCFNLLAPEAHDRYYLIDGVRPEANHMLSTGRLNGQVLEMVDHWTGVRIRIATDHEISFWRAPIQTVSASESGIERVYQGSLVLPRFETTLKPGEPQTFLLSVSIGDAE